MPRGSPLIVLMISRTCQAILQGHTSLVGQLQMCGNTLVTGGSDGSVRVWSLTSYSPIHRLAAHDNSVTSLQFDDARIVSGGSDGRVRIWDTGTGSLMRELSQPAEAVWRVAFESERCVVMACRGGRTIMEVWDFAPPADDGKEGSGRSTPLTDGEVVQETDMLDVVEGASGRETVMDGYRRQVDDHKFLTADDMFDESDEDD